MSKGVKETLIFLLLYIVCYKLYFFLFKKNVPLKKESFSNKSLLEKNNIQLLLDNSKKEINANKENWLIYMLQNKIKIIL